MANVDVVALDTNSKAESTSYHPDWYDGAIRKYAQNWNQSFPFQLVIVRESGADSGSYVPLDDQSTFTLPIPPREMTISMPFAIQTSFTLGGVVEEHAGTPYRHISFEGTTGVAPYRHSVDKIETRGQGLLEGLVGGTLRAVDSLKRSWATLTAQERPYDSNLHTADGSWSAASGLSDEASSTGIPFYTTGYYQFHLLRKFLERYAAMKTQQENADVRLALAVWKDAAVHLVTPVRFDMRRSSTQPLEYLYTLQFKAWKRVNLLADGSAVSSSDVTIRGQSQMGLLASKMNDALVTLDSVSGVIAGLRGDANRVINICKTVSRMVRVSAGLVIEAINLPLDILDSVESAYRAERTAWDGVGETWSRTKSRYGLTSNSGRSRTADDLLSDTTLPLTLRNQISQTLDQTYTLTDLLTMRAELVSASDSLAEQVGASHPDYADLYGGSAKSNREPTYNELRALWTLQVFIEGVEALIASANEETAVKPSSLDYVAALANRSGITLEAAQSKFAVPVPYGTTLERLSRLYLGTPDRWHEIAVLNGLRSPYIDETGFERKLLLNGENNRVVISTDENLYPGQQVFIYSSTIPRERRRVTSIKSYGERHVVVELDGPANLERFRVNENATLHAFLPNTTNSQQVLFIPSSREPTFSPVGRLPGEIDRFDSLLEAGGVDIQVNDDGDLILGDDGDSPWSYGLNNIVQSLRIILTTRRGSLDHHVEFGVPVAVGSNVRDLDVAQVARDIETSIRTNSTFSDVQGLRVVQDGGTLSISLTVTVRGSGERIPVSFTMKT